MTTEPSTQPVSEDVDDQAAPLDALLVEAALGPLRRFTPAGSTVKFALRLARRPTATGRRLVGLAAELARIGAGTSTAAPSKRDRRFTDPAWSENPLLRRVVQAYQAAGRTAEQLVSDAALGWRDERRMRFLVENLVAALSPSNLPLVNPASAKAVVDTAGLNFVRGGRNLTGAMHPGVGTGFLGGHLDWRERRRIQPERPLRHHLPVDVFGDTEDQWARNRSHASAQAVRVEQAERQVDLLTGGTLRIQHDVTGMQDRPHPDASRAGGRPVVGRERGGEPVKETPKHAGGGNRRVDQRKQAVTGARGRPPVGRHIDAGQGLLGGGAQHPP
jgi:hypothetical protein